MQFYMNKSAHIMLVHFIRILIVCECVCVRKAVSTWYYGITKQMELENGEKIPLIT